MPISTQSHSHLIIVRALSPIIMRSFDTLTIQSNILMPVQQVLSRIIISSLLLLRKLCSTQHLQVMSFLSIIDSWLFVSGHPYMKDQFHYLFWVLTHILVQLVVHQSSLSYIFQQYWHRLAQCLFWFNVKEWHFWKDFSVFWLLNWYQCQMTW